MSLGGGGQSGGAIVQSTDPGAANLAGMYGMLGANQAASISKDATNTAIANLNNQYLSGAQNLRPYTQTGVEALDKLNQYLGLSAYKPLTGPTAPIAPKNPITGLASAAGGLLPQLNAINAPRGTPAQTAQGIDQYDLVASVANQLAGGGVPSPMSPTGFNPSDMYFLNQLSQAGGSVGMSGNDLRTALTDPSRPEAQLFASQQAQYNQDLANYDYANQLYNQYSGQGPKTAEQISNEISNQPGYQAELSQGVSAIGKSAAARGYLGSGAILKDLSQFGQNTLSKYYNNTLSNLSSLANSGQQAASTIGGMQANLGNNTANLYQAQGENQANAALAGSNALMQGLITGNQQFKQMGGSGGGLGGIGDLLGGVASLKSAFSSKELKVKVSTPSTKEILDKVSDLSLDKWKYKGIDREHIGPYAEEFNQAFGLDQTNSINLIDAVGVLLGSVKELKLRIEQLEKGN